MIRSVLSCLWTETVAVQMTRETRLYSTQWKAYLHCLYPGYSALCAIQYVENSKCVFIYICN